MTAATQDNGGSEPPNASHDTVERAEPPRVLVVEDDPPSRLFLVTLMERQGYRVEAAANGREAVAAVKRSPCDIVLMDIQLPLMDGIEATKKIRALGGRAARLPIIAVTASVKPGDREKYLAAGMNGHVSKLINIETLLRVMESWLTRQVDEAKGDQKSSRLRTHKTIPSGRRM